MQVFKRPKTPAELLAEIKTVHGAGSGLDADQLDGNHADYFVNALAADTYGRSGPPDRSAIR